jgi:hypothetical protein
MKKHYLFGKEAVNAYHMAEHRKDVAIVLLVEREWQVLEIEELEDTTKALELLDKFGAFTEIDEDDYNELLLIRPKYA